MKKIVLTLSICIAAAAALHAQTWKLVPVWSDQTSARYLSCGMPAGDSDQNEPLFFSLWGYHFYDDEQWNFYEAEYLRATPAEMNRILGHIADFAERWRSEQAESREYGVKVKTFRHPIMGIYTCVYAPDGRDLCMYKVKRWASIYDAFTEFCRENGIETE